jgi:hypothetical protein
LSLSESRTQNVPRLSRPLCYTIGLGKRSFTDDELRQAAASARSLRAVVRALGLASGSAGYVAKCISEAGLDVSHFTTKAFASTSSRVSDARLRELVPKCKSLTDLLEASGLGLHGNNFTRLRKRISLLAIDTSHFTRTVTKSGKRPTKWTDERLRDAVAASFSIAETIRGLGLVPAGGNYDQVQRRIRELGIDTAHFTGQGWNKGGKFVATPALPLEQVLVAGRWTGSHLLKKRLFRAGLKKPQCELCGWCERAPDGRIPVELDHINGDRFDNRLENLRILCPNCHSLQSTHRGLNKRSVRDRASEDVPTVGWGWCVGRGLDGASGGT